MNTIKITIQETLALRGAFLALDGIDLQSQSNGQPVTVRQNFKFPAQGVRRKIVRNLRLLETEYKDFLAARDALIREVSGGEQVQAAQLGEFNKRMAALLNETVDLNLEPLSEDELNLDENEIPSTTAALILATLAVTPAAAAQS
jgi:hypothetical protein